MDNVVPKRRHRTVGRGGKSVQQTLSRVDDDVVDAGRFYGPYECRQCLVAVFFISEGEASPRILGRERNSREKKCHVAREGGREVSSIRREGTEFVLCPV